MTKFLQRIAGVARLPGLASQAEVGDGDSGPPPDPWSQVADWTAFGFSLVAIAGMVTFYLPVRVTGWLLALLIAVAAGIVVRAVLVRRRSIPSGPAAEKPFSARSFPTAALPGLVFAGIVVFRFIQAVELALPAWVDSVHHTLLVRLILEGGRLPASFEPFMPVPLFYHTGFHTNTALFAALTGLSPERAVLIFGQILNAAVALGVYRLGRALWGDERRALVAMLLVGFAFQMPAYYLSWGRYTLLAGVFLLAIAMAAALDLVRKPERSGGAVRLAVLTAGLLLTHYFAAVLFALFLVVLVLERALSERGFFRSPSLRDLFAGAAAGGLIALPWVVRVWSMSSNFIGLAVVPPTASPDEVFFTGYLDYLKQLLGPDRAFLLHGLGLAGLVLLGWRREVRPLAVFTLVAGVLSLPWGLRLAPFRPDHGVILAFLPASLLAADALISPLQGEWGPRVRIVLRGLVGAALVGILVWGIRDTHSIVNPATVLADEADVAALAWIAANTPEDAVFLINTAYWQEGAYRGVDGGWWIAPIAGRRTALPPALYLNGELEYVRTVLDQAQRMAAVDGCSAELFALLEETGATHIYLHQGKGSLQPASLAGCEGLEPVYAEGEVFIFQVR